MMPFWMRISDWSADVFSSDLVVIAVVVLEVDVAALLLADRVFAGRLAATGAVVVADEHAGVVGQRVEQPPDRPVQQVRAAAGEIAACGAAVGHEQRVAGERSEERRVGKECVSTCRSRWSP